MVKQLSMLVLGWTVSLMLSSTSLAQFKQPTLGSKHVATVIAGYDHNLISINIGYARYIETIKAAGFIDFTQGTALLGTANWRLQAGVRSWAGTSRKFNLRSSLAVVYTKSSNKAGKFDGLGLNIHLNPGIHGKKLGLGADIQYMPFLATRIRHSEFWRQNYYANAQDGWYKSTSHHYRLGIYVSSFVDRRKSLELSLRGGYQSSGQFDKLIPSVYGVIGVSKIF